MFFSLFRMIFLFFKQFGFLGILGPPGNHTSRWIRDLWSKGISLILAYISMCLTFCVLDDISVFQKIWVLSILGPSYCGIGATIRIGREMLCLPYAGFFKKLFSFFFCMIMAVNYVMSKTICIIVDHTFCAVLTFKYLVCKITLFSSSLCNFV